LETLFLSFSPLAAKKKPETSTMNTACTAAESGIGEYNSHTPYAELKLLIEEGRRVMQLRGLEGDDLRQAARMYARTMIHFYQQSGWQPLNAALENEFVDRVIAELALGHHHHHKSTALTTREFNYGITLYDPHLNGLEPFIPATYPEPAPHLAPKTPEEYVEPAPDAILDLVETRCCVLR
jgi:hypothetical protein